MLRNRIFRSFVGFIVLNNFYANVSAQDAHYWTLQYGPKSSLLGGAVIGSVNDVSATFYNPGELALAEDLAFAVSADVFEFSSVTLEGGGVKELIWDFAFWSSAITHCRYPEKRSFWKGCSCLFRAD